MQAYALQLYNISGLKQKMDIINDYTNRIALALQEENKYKKLANKYSLLRLLVFGFVILSVGVAIKLDDFTFLAIGFLLMAFVFMWLVSKQSYFEKQRSYFANLVKVTENELNSIFVSANIYSNGDGFNNEKHFYSADLDIFGKASLFNLINRAATTNGNKKIADWLSAPAQKDEILLRQEAVNEIANKNSWKLETQALLLFANNDSGNHFQNLFQYLKISLDMPGEKWLAIYAKIAPILLTTTLTISWFSPVFRSISVILGLMNIGLVFTKAEYIKKADLIAGKIGHTLNNYASVFEKVEKETWQSVYGKQLAHILEAGQTSANIKALSNLINKLNYHLNMIVGVLLNVFFLWDIRQVIAIENWKRNNRLSLQESFDVIADFEALFSLASLRINYTDWAVPEIAESNGYTLIAKGLAHPLINSQKRVENDYELDKSFKIDIITGSNMAGKSTFLRTIGINTVLALSGATVCAREMQLSVMTIISYMRIKDNLNESTSTFKAELDRLQMLLAAVGNENKVFFLIDEMLRGTNSVDKYLGSKAVIKQLIRKNAVGLVATHDLQIADLENEYPEYVRNFYFDIQVKEGEMLFDYKIKHGACKTFNATLLLKQIGIDVEE